MDDFATRKRDPDIDVYIKELMQLKKWRDEIEIPAQQQNESLQIIIEQIKEQNKVLSLELQTYTEEVDKLKKKNHDLSFELQSAIELGNSNIFEDQQRDTKLFELKQRCEELEWKQLDNEENIDELTENNNSLKKENQQYQMILDKLQKEEISLKTKMSKDYVELHELQLKYDTLGQELTSMQSINRHTSEFAKELQSELTDLEHIDHEYELNTHNKTIRMDHFNDLDNTYLGAGDGVGKSYRAAPQTLRFVEQFSDDATLEKLDSDRGNIDIISVVKETLENEYKMEISALNEEIIGYKNKLIEKDNKESAMDQRIRVIEERVSKEKQQLIEKHNEQIVEYQKKFILKENELIKLRKDASSNETRNTNHSNNDQIPIFSYFSCF